MPETYDAYSMMTAKTAGQYFSVGVVAGQWAWTPRADGVSEIAWGDPAAWPPPTFERFEHDSGDEWVYMLGYGSLDGQWLPQVVTAEWQGPDLAHLTPMTVDPLARQRYVKWTIPTASYALVAEGTMDWLGTPIRWRHQQVWSPPATLGGNPYLGPKVCIKQSERWWDDFGSDGQMIEKTRRDHYIAKGLGPAFWINDQLHTWQAHGRYYWRWG